MNLLPWACRVKVQRAQRGALNSSKNDKDFDAIQHNTQKHAHETLHFDKCKYFGTGHMPQQCPANGKKCGGNVVKMFCRSSQRQQANWQAKKMLGKVHQGVRLTWYNKKSMTGVLKW